MTAARGSQRGRSAAVGCCPLEDLLQPPSPTTVFQAARSHHARFFKLSASLRICSASECRIRSAKIAAMLVREVARTER